MRSVWNDFDSGTRTLLLALVLALYMGACFTLSALACSLWMGLDLSANPFDVVVGLVRGEIPSYVGTTALVFGIGFLVLALVGFIVFPGKSSRARGDDAARLATRSKRDIAPLMRSAVAAKAKRLGIEGSAIGLPVGKTVAYGVPVYSSFEDVTVNISGPRTGKTTCWVVPRILAAPGAVLATSNRRVQRLGKCGFLTLKIWLQLSKPGFGIRLPTSQMVCERLPWREFLRPRR